MVSSTVSSLRGNFAHTDCLPDDYETHSRFAQKIVPLPLPPPRSFDSQTQAPENLGVSGPESCFAVRCIPLKIYLPDNAPEVQDIVNPLNPQGELMHRHPRPWLTSRDRYSYDGTASTQRHPATTLSPCRAMRCRVCPCHTHLERRADPTRSRDRLVGRVCCRS